MHTTTKDVKTLSNVTINKTMCWLSQLRHYEHIHTERCVNGNEYMIELLLSILGMLMAQGQGSHYSDDGKSGNLVANSTRKVHCMHTC